MKRGIFAQNHKNIAYIVKIVGEETNEAKILNSKLDYTIKKC